MLIAAVFTTAEMWKQENAHQWISAFKKCGIAL
jgi:hypothetical protein